MKNTRTEIFAGFTTFMTMSYIMFANPAILSAAGMAPSAALTATCLGSAIACILMAWLAKYPFALAPGMGLNAFLVFTVCQGMGYSWQTGMAVVVIEGAIITVLVLAGLRQWVMDALPNPLKHAIGVGIGLFIAFIGLQQGGIVTKDANTLLTLGNMASPEVIVTLVGLAATVAMMVWRVPGALLLGILLAAVVAGVFCGVATLPRTLDGFIARPDFSAFGGFREGMATALTLPLLPVVFAFLMTDFFDTMGTVIAVGSQAGFVDRRGRMPRLGRVLFVDSIAALLGGVVGASSITTYVESASGVAAGGRTGIVPFTVGVLFILGLFFSPLAGAIPSCAVAPALIVVGFLMMGCVVRIRWTKLEEGIPAFLAILLMPLSFSISTGVGWGIIGFVAIEVFRGRALAVHPLMWLTAAVFAVSFSPLVPR